MDEDPNVCGGEICTSGLEVDEPTITYCLSVSCCAEFVACTSGTPRGVEACIDCFNQGGGPLCDAALSCAENNCKL